MSFRVSAFVAVLAALGLGSVTPALAQPQAPLRPRASGFSSIFTPGQQQQILMGNTFGGGASGPGAGALVVPYVNPNFAGAQGGLGSPGGAIPNAYSTIAPPTTAGGATFNNLGHWYSSNYGHWYPNGIANGRGVAGTSGGNFGMAGGPQRSGGALGMIGGTALGVGATMNQFRR